MKSCVKEQVSEHHLHNLPAGERPYEKCIRHGPSVLSDAELLAVILRTGSAGENVLELARKLCRASEAYPGLAGLYHLRRDQLLQIHGIGEVKASQLLCIAELSRRMARARSNPMACMNSAAKIADYYMEEMCHLDREELRLVLLDSKNRLIRDTVLTTGTVNMAPVCAREIFREALLHNAVSVILLHNHPSGDASPSTEDISATLRVRDAGNLIGIPLVDHIIIGDHAYCSLHSYCQCGKPQGEAT